MQAKATVSSDGTNTDNKRQSHAAEFKQVLDGRKQPIRGLCVRNGRYYARLSFEADNGGKAVRRVPLLDKDKNPVATRAEAVKAFESLKTKREDNDLPVLTRTPKFADYVKTYLAFIKSGQEDGQGMKKPATIEKEEYTLAAWVKHMGGAHLDKIRLSHINAFTSKRLTEDKVSKRTVALDIICLTNVLNHALDEGWIKTVPKLSKEGRKRLKGITRERPLFSADDLETFCNAALETKADKTPVTKNGQQFADYLRLMAFSGTRRNEALGLQWTDVDFESEVLNVRRQVTSRGVETLKNKQDRKVDFTAKLKAHLLEMQKRRAPDSQWLFPSPQRGDKDIPAKSFRESLELVRDHIKNKHPELAEKAFHDLRHFFISYCVMSGIDYMTIAEWAGHQDGGILIGKVYGHLANEHKKEQAQRVNFGPVVLEASA